MVKNADFIVIGTDDVTNNVTNDVTDGTIRNDSGTISNDKQNDEEREEIKTAFTLSNHHTASSREEYINRISTNSLALKVKLNDLRNNMDITRIPEPSDKDYARLDRYEKEYHILIDALNHFH